MNLAAYYTMPLWYYGISTGFFPLSESMYKTGTTISVRIVDTRSPPIIVHPIAPHISPPTSVRGSRPLIVVAVVVASLATLRLFHASVTSSFTRLCASSSRV